MKDIEINQEFEDTFLVEKADVASTKKGTLYASMTLRYKGGSIEAKWWHYDPMSAHLVKAGVVIEVHGIMGEYNGVKQAKIEGIRPSDKDPSFFARQTELDIPTMWGEVVGTITTFSEPVVKFIAEDLFSNAKVAEAFQKAPAAMGVHNNWTGGLLEHVCSMLKIAKFVFKHYSELDAYKSYRISRDKILFGVIFHDIGKILEYDLTNPAFDKTPEGYLTNHMVLGPAWILRSASKMADLPEGTIPKDVIQKECRHLMHLVASHHGCLEWGSPVVPSTIEAIILHQIDNLDTKVMHALDLVKTALEKDDAAVTSEYSRTERTKFMTGR